MGASKAKKSLKERKTQKCGLDGKRGWKALKQAEAIGPGDAKKSKTEKKGVNLFIPSEFKMRGEQHTDDGRASRINHQHAKDGTKRGKRTQLNQTNLREKQRVSHGPLLNRAD